jgi:methyltransferase
MTGSVLLLSFLTLQRGLELVVATKNTRALLARGAYEVGGSHYPVMVALHATWLATLWIALFVVLQLGRVWVLATLGRRWTTRIVMVPGEAPIVSGPFRLVRHPNYLVVALEIPCVPLALGLVWHAIAFGFANLAMLWWRIRTENRAYAELT